MLQVPATHVDLNSISEQKFDNSNDTDTMLCRNTQSDINRHRDLAKTAEMRSLLIRLLYGQPSSAKAAEL